MMEMGMLACFVMLQIISLAPVEARYITREIAMDEGYKLQYKNNQPSESTCESCLEPLKSDEKTSRDSKLLEELGLLSTEVCQILSSDSKAKCLETSVAYAHRSRLLVNGIFNEETLCKSTGLCLLKSMFSTINGLALVQDNSTEVTDEHACTACRKSVKDIFAGLNKPKMRMKVMEALIEYCEEVEDNEKDCKQKVYKYAPIALSRLEKLRTNEFCRMMGFCDEGIL